MKKGSTLLMLLLGIIMIAAMSLMYMRDQSGTVQNPDRITASFDQAWNAVCKANKAAIEQALQIHSIHEGPMKKLDMRKLFPSGLPNKHPKCPCNYELDENGRVYCTYHDRTAEQ